MELGGAQKLQAQIEKRIEAHYGKTLPISMLQRILQYSSLGAIDIAISRKLFPLRVYLRHGGTKKFVQTAEVAGYLADHYFKAKKIS